MPIFQDHFGSYPESLPPSKSMDSPQVSPSDTGRDDSEESIPSIFRTSKALRNIERPADSRGVLQPNFVFPAHTTSDRAELMNLLKRGESPTWLPTKNLSAIIQNYNPNILKNSSKAPPSSPLLPAAEISHRTSPVEVTPLQAGLVIERPPAAFHSGDFADNIRQRNPKSKLFQDSYSYAKARPSRLSSSPPRPTSQHSLFQVPEVSHSSLAAKSRATSLSSFVFKSPTSPLVQSESNDDPDISSLAQASPLEVDLSKSYRRHSLQMHAHTTNTGMPSSSIANRPLPNLRRDNTFPYQAQQPRRSFNSNPCSQLASPQTPPAQRPCRPSITPDSSPRLHAPMVGSYEESILKGRMSTTPSKPLEFIAQIGVLGLGNCKPALRCPAHVTIPFPVVFYSYDTTSYGRPATLEDGPSPYVGQVDIENSLPDPAEARGKRRRQAILEKRACVEHSSDVVVADSCRGLEQDVRRSVKQKRRSVSTRTPPGGSYRLPEKGQLQIIVKNPNKTAVKLFLVPYDLTGMKSGTKTFVRQRSYSAGPILDSAQLPSSAPTHEGGERATLRYLIHLQFCCPSHGRYYLYKSIRVVFANRVPDGKEKLRNEISLPEPRFSVYKPIKDTSFSSGAKLTAETAFRRRSAGFALGSFHVGPIAPIRPIPSSLFRGAPLGDGDADVYRPADAFLSHASSSSRPSSSSGVSEEVSRSWLSDDHPMISSYEKLKECDVSYGGHVYAECHEGIPDTLDSLLVRKLKGLGVALPNAQDRVDDL